MNRAKKLSALKKVLGACREKGDEAVFFCPKHGAKAGRLEGQLSVNLKVDWFNCWSCGFKGVNVAPLLKLRGVTQEYVEYVRELEHDRLHKELPPAHVYDRVTLPAAFRSFSEPSSEPAYAKALGYMAARGLHPDDLLRWRLGYCPEGEYAGRVIVPSFDVDGSLNYLVGRSYSGHPWRYKTGNYDKDVVWNECMVDWSSPVTVVEGPFDAFTVAENVTTLQGNTFPRALVSKIVESGCDAYFAMDSDAFRRQMKHILALASYGVTCYHVDLGGAKDPGSMSREVFEERKKSATLVRGELDALRLRVMRIGT